MKIDMRNFSISVAMATYNGEKYIEKQLLSILSNLESMDEVIISDDGSTDNTKDIIKSIGDKRVIVIDGPGEGIIANFENAISNCGGRYIFLSDQDDVWANNKVEKVLQTFEKTSAAVVVHDCRVVDSEGNLIEESFFKFRNSGPGKFKNIYKNTYVGCCMAFNAALKDAVLPIPRDIEMHDQWIGLAGDAIGDNVFIEDKLIDFVRHTDNSSDPFNHHSIGKMLVNRLILMKRLLSRGF